MSDQSATIAPEPEGNGWFVVVTVPKVGGIGSADQLLFAAAIADAADAKRAIQQALGGLHCTIEARIRMTPKALARMDVSTGEIKRLSS